MFLTKVEPNSLFGNVALRLTSKISIPCLIALTMVILKALNAASSWEFLSKRTYTSVRELNFRQNDRKSKQQIKTTQKKNDKNIGESKKMSK